MGNKLLWTGFTTVLILNRIDRELAIAGIIIMAIGCVALIFDK